jgi:hypothetical protein
VPHETALCGIDPLRRIVLMQRSRAYHVDAAFPSRNDLSADNVDPVIFASRVPAE